MLADGSADRKVDPSDHNNGAVVLVQARLRTDAQ
jgi:hypothetical protein